MPDPPACVFAGAHQPACGGCRAGHQHVNQVPVSPPAPLQVLNSQPVEAAEQAASRSKYAGHLMLDFLTERTGCTTFESLQELDLSGLGIRDVGNVFGREDLAGLRQLSLDNNELSEVRT